MKEKGNVVSVCVGDHFCFGEGESRLLNPEAAHRRIRAWRDELGAGALLWREVTSLAREFRYSVYPRLRSVAFRGLPWDELREVPLIARDLGVKAFLHVSIFDEGCPEPRRAGSSVAVSWRSLFSRLHPAYALVDRHGRRQWGVLCLAYPEVRRHFLARIEARLAAGEWDGVFVCLRSQSRPADHADQFGFNEPVMRDYRERHGEEFELQRWRDVMGSYLTEFLRELRPLVPRLAVGVPRGDVMGPPFGNATLPWREWGGIVDDLVINQDSTRCPARMHPLWPEIRGKGYLQDYRTGHGMPPLPEHLDRYPPVFVARQWDDRDSLAEDRLLGHPSVRGLVFSSYRHDHSALAAPALGA